MGRTVFHYCLDLVTLRIGDCIWTKHISLRYPQKLMYRADGLNEIEFRIGHSAFQFTLDDIIGYHMEDVGDITMEEDELMERNLRSVSTWRVRDKEEIKKQE